jgi:hypothetical protein
MRRYMRRYMYMYMYIHNRIHNRIRIRICDHLRNQYCYLRNLIAFCGSNASNASNKCVANIMICVNYHFLI